MPWSACLALIHVLIHREPDVLDLRSHPDVVRSALQRAEKRSRSGSESSSEEDDRDISHVVRIPLPYDLLIEAASRSGEGETYESSYARMFSREVMVLWPIRPGLDLATGMQAQFADTSGNYLGPALPLPGETLRDERLHDGALFIRLVLRPLSEKEKAQKARAERSRL